MLRQSRSQGQISAFRHSVVAQRRVVCPTDPSDHWSETAAASLKRHHVRDRSSVGRVAVVAELDEGTGLLIRREKSPSQVRILPTALNDGWVYNLLEIICSKFVTNAIKSSPPPL